MPRLISPRATVPDNHETGNAQGLMAHGYPSSTNASYPSNHHHQMDRFPPPQRAAAPTTSLAWEQYGIGQPTTPSLRANYYGVGHACPSQRFLGEPHLNAFPSHASAHGTGTATAPLGALLSPLGAHMSPPLTPGSPLVVDSPSATINRRRTTPRGQEPSTQEEQVLNF